MVDLSMQPVRIDRLFGRVLFLDDGENVYKSMDCKIQQYDVFHKGDA